MLRRLAPLLVLPAWLASACSHAPPAPERVEWCEHVDGPASPGRSAAPPDVPWEAFKEPLRFFSADVAACYQRSLRRQPWLQGKVTARWVIDAEGRTAAPCLVAKETTIHDQGLELCVLKAIARWSFEEKPRKAVRVTHPWVLVQEKPAARAP